MIGTTLSDTGLNVSKEIVVLGETTALKPKQEAFQVKSQPCSSESAKYELPQIILPTRSSASNIIAGTVDATCLYGKYFRNYKI